MSSAYFRILDTVAKPHWGEILRCLSLHAPAPVKSIAKRLNMSYMGIKQHCQEMHTVGLLQVREEKGGVGRPRHLYYMTEDAWALFPESPNGLESSLISHINETEGVTVSHKMLLAWFQKTADALLTHLPPSGVDRWKEARIKLMEAGCVVEWVKRGNCRVPALLVSHRPWAASLESSPPLLRLETQFLSTVCGLTFEREIQERELMPPTILFYQL